jgi:hypothetical protein
LTEETLQLAKVFADSMGFRFFFFPWFPMLCVVFYEYLSRDDLVTHPSIFETGVCRLERPASAGSQPTKDQ